MITARDALQRLRDGNARFVKNVRGSDVFLHSRRPELTSEQEPIAIVLGCSDARVPAEIVFDQGLGDLFVIRVAGNIVAPSQVGSVEFAASRFGTPLVIVLGHTDCGAVAATLEDVKSGPSHSPNLRSIVDRIRPAVETVMASVSSDEARVMRLAVRANVRVSANHLRHGSALLERLIHLGGLLVVGAEYSLDTGEVDFFDVPVEAQQTT
jgi:carbonic anhydrase